MLKVGELAPDFILVSQDGKTVRLSDFKGKSNVVLYFYPKDFTPGCTKEACSFRDHLESFKRLNTEVLGVSADDEESHRGFQKKHNLNFTLLADPERKVIELYGVKGFLGWAKRLTFLIDRNGVIRKIYPDVDVSVHSEEVLASVKEFIQPAQ